MWTAQRFQERLKGIAEVFRRAFPGGPDIAALQEVETERALSSLCDGPLTSMGYIYRVLVPVDGQAVHCALLSRLPVKRVGALHPAAWENRSQRVILEAEIVYRGHPLYVFVNHWKSKSQGVERTASARIASSRVLTERIRTLLAENSRADIVVLGDFNENVEEFEETGRRFQTALVPDEEGEFPAPGSLLLADTQEAAGSWEDRLVLYDLWFEGSPTGWGSYVYGRRWQTPDHILLSSGLFDSEGFYYDVGGYEVMRSSFLVDQNSGFPLGEAHARSDHLPLKLTLKVPR
jgi:endonuclease/exonuclease/phosphatase family metal-dependent hydrolase